MLRNIFGLYRSKYIDFKGGTTTVDITEAEKSIAKFLNDFETYSELKGHVLAMANTKENTATLPNSYREVLHYPQNSIHTDSKKRHKVRLAAWFVKTM